MKRAFLFLAMLLMGVLTFAEETITVSANSDFISVSCSPESSKAVTTNCNKRIDLTSNIKSYQILFQIFL